MFLFHYSLTDSVSFLASTSLESTRVEMEDSIVKIWCAFKDGVEGASCVVIYREYGNKTLVVKEYHQIVKFPITITVDHSDKAYTLAVFGKNGSDIDKRPYYYFVVEEGDEKEEEEGESSDENDEIGIIAGAFLMCMCSCSTHNMTVHNSDNALHIMINVGAAQVNTYKHKLTFQSLNGLDTSIQP